jgi:hypothetical protein
MKKPKDVKRRMRPVVDAILRINDALAAVGEAVAGESGDSEQLAVSPLTTRVGGEGQRARDY